MRAGHVAPCRGVTRRHAVLGGPQDCRCTHLVSYYTVFSLFVDNPKWQALEFGFLRAWAPGILSAAVDSTPLSLNSPALLTLALTYQAAH